MLQSQERIKISHFNPLFSKQQLLDFKRGYLDSAGRYATQVATFADEMDALIAKTLSRKTNSKSGGYAVNDLSESEFIVPGQGEAGSAEHNQHQQNSRDIEKLGLMYLLTGENAYLQQAESMLLAYSDRYLELDFFKQKNTNPPGRLFHQILNEQMWLLYVSLGYGYLKSDLSQTSIDRIENRLIKPMIKLFAEENAHDFDRIHNHGLWAVAAVGIASIVVDEQHYLNMCIDGLNGNRKDGGFMAQLDQLFSKSGYYVEGPYYHRFAIRPLCIFAEALNQHRPELKIYLYNDQMIRKTVDALLQSAYPNGVFPALNDASRTMDINDEGVVIGLAVRFFHYGASTSILETAANQDSIWMHPYGQLLADHLPKFSNTDSALSRENTFHNSSNSSLKQSEIYWPSVELKEGAQGEKGGQGILRSCAKTGDINQVWMAYGQHGLDHGHFDGLGLTWFNRGQEVLREYGFGRWINIEDKFGGRYLPENKSWARQTIAHNTVVVDEASQNNGDQTTADQKFGESHFFVGEGRHQGMSARIKNYYPGVFQQRTLLSLDVESFEQPLLIDIVRIQSEQIHQYDYPIHYQGQLINTQGADIVRLNNLLPLGNESGYQHLFKMAEVELNNPNLMLTWLQGSSFYTWISTVKAGDKLILAKTGANDSNFNLRSEDCMILRSNAKDKVFASVFESHGNFDEATEKCLGGKTSLHSLKVIHDSSLATILRVDFNQGNFRSLDIMVANSNGDLNAKHQVDLGEEKWQWTGPFSVEIQ